MLLCKPPLLLQLSPSCPCGWAGAEAEAEGYSALLCSQCTFSSCVHLFLTPLPDFNSSIARSDVFSRAVWLRRRSLITCAGLVALAPVGGIRREAGP